MQALLLSLSPMEKFAPPPVPLPCSLPVFLAIHFLTGLAILLLTRPSFVLEEGSFHFPFGICISMACTAAAFTLYHANISPSDTFRGAMEMAYSASKLA